MSIECLPQIIESGGSVQLDCLANKKVDSLQYSWDFRPVGSSRWYPRDSVSSRYTENEFSAQKAGIYRCAVKSLKSQGEAEISIFFIDHKFKTLNCSNTYIIETSNASTIVIAAGSSLIGLLLILWCIQYKRKKKQMQTTKLQHDMKRQHEERARRALEAEEMRGKSKLKKSEKSGKRKEKK